MIVEEAGRFQGMFGFGPIVKQHRYGRKGLHRYGSFLHLLKPYRRIPAVLLYFPEDFIPFDHAGATRLVVLEGNEVAVPELLKPVRDLLGHNMGVYINFHSGNVRINYFLFAAPAFAAAGRDAPSDLRYHQLRKNPVTIMITPSHNTLMNGNTIAFRII